MALNILVTTAGRAALVNAANTGTAPVTIAQVGFSQTAVAPAVGMTALPDEFKRIGAVSGDVVADDMIHISVLDESADAYTLRAFALYLQDGTLFAVYGQADPILSKTATSFAALAVDTVFADISAALLTFGGTDFLNPPATVSRQGVVELATSAETNTGTDTQRAVTPRAFADALSTRLDARFGSGNSAIWHPGNDGAGSGLDADLLDGQEGSYYTNIPARLGYTPINRAGDTVTATIFFRTTDSASIAARANSLAALHAIGNGTGPAIMSFERPNAYAAYFGIDTDNRWKVGGWSMGAVAHELWHSGNDGAGSGLDADLLDGQDSSYYTSIPARLGYTPINRAGDTVTATINFRTGDSASIAARPNSPAALHAIANGNGPAIMSFERPNAYAAYFGIDTDNRWKVGGWSMGAVAHELWHSGNDGAGSGLDADLLDGQQGSYYTNIPARLGFTPANKAGDTFTGPVTVPGFTNTNARTFLAADANGNHWFGAVGIASEPGRLGYGFRTSNGAIVSHTFMVGGAARLLISDTSMQFNSSTVWHAGNDGAGSGLDADLLDGQQGSYYSDIVGRLGYQPVRRDGDTMSGPLALDYAGNVGLSLNSSGAVIARLVAQADGNVVLYRNGGIDDAAVWSVKSQAGPFEISMPITRQNNSVWDAGNDGAGSGLDADLLDGQQGSFYTNIPARLGYTPINRAGDTVTATINFRTTDSASIAARPNSLSALHAIGNGTGPAIMSFERPNAYAAYFGIDTDNRWKVGGWSMGAVAHELWHSGNDGAGSGLDADLLDGQQGSFYTNIPARLGYTPYNSAGGTITGAVDVNYSGNVTFTLNSTASVIARLAAQADGNIALYRNAGSGDAAVWSVGSQTGPFNIAMPISRQGNVVWDAGNDGSGSGLDADTLDGLQGSDYLRIIAESKSASGYMRLSNGLVLQWGRWTSPAIAGQAITVTFPIAFSEEPYTLVTMAVVTTASDISTWSSNGITGASFPARCNQASIGCRYFAVGPV